MSSSVSNSQLLNNTEHRVKFKTGSDINNVLDPIVGEVFLEDSKPSSISFDGSGYLDLNSNFQSLLSDSFALSMWVKLTDTSELTLLFGATNQANSDRFYAFHSGGVVSTFYNANGSSNADGIGLNTSSIDLTSWTHLLFTYQNRWTGAAKHDIIHTVYANGVSIGTVTKTDPTGDSSMATYGSVNSAVNLFIGARNNWGTQNLPSTGLFDQIALFNLTESEVSGYLPAGFEQDLANSIWNNGVMTKINSLNPFGLWDMDNKSVKDKGSGGNNGTLYNGAFSTTDMPPNENPALYTCTNKQGTISKVSGNLAKMGDVPMLKLNQQKLDLTDVSYNFFPHSGSGTFCYSFWFYDDGSSEERYEIIHHGDGGLTNVVVAHGSSSSEYGTLEFTAHGDFDNAAGKVAYTSPDSGVSVGGWWNPSIVTTRNTGFNLKYKKNKLNNFTFVKVNGVKNPTHTSGSRYVYLNGELVASDEGSSFFTYPKGGFKAIGARDTKDVGINRAILLGDIMYWDQDISSIAAEIYNPLSIHKGYQGDARNLSIPPRNYWRLGLGTTGGEFRDAGSDGANHFIPNTVSSDQYEYKNIFGIDRSGES